MTTETHTADAVRVTDSAAEHFAVAKQCFRSFGVLSTIALGIVVAVAATGHTVSSFMWIRGGLLPAIAVLLYRNAVAGARGDRRSYERIRSLSVVLPIAIVGVDLIPGVCPLWYAIMQTIGMIPVVAAAFVTRRPAVRAAFPKNS